ncbi:MAG: prepilin-type N-terminal cleavage/methylation domain-containing protein [Lentisphaeria bacterium]|nr:prepilin-type N-terminal cleavage/methylation domain-containing protein [Lentisphaeria bacterium]
MRKLVKYSILNDRFQAPKQKKGEKKMKVNSSRFTLIELLVVIAIITILPVQNF